MAEPPQPPAPPEAEAEAKTEDPRLETAVDTFMQYVPETRTRADVAELVARLDYDERDIQAEIATWWPTAQPVPDADPAALAEEAPAGSKKR